MKRLLESRAMLSREYLREHADAYRTALKNRGASVDLDRFLELDAERRRTIAGSRPEGARNGSQEISLSRSKSRMRARSKR